MGIKRITQQVYYNGSRTSWYIPGMPDDAHINLKPETFTPDILPKGRIDQGTGQPPLLPTPVIPGRISTRKDGYIELILERHYDKESKQTRNKKAIIGQDASFILPRMMIPNDTYFEHFNLNGIPISDAAKSLLSPSKQEEEPEQEQQYQQTQNPDQPTQADQPTQKQKTQQYQQTENPNQPTQQDQQPQQNQQTLPNQQTSADQQTSQQSNQQTYQQTNQPKTKGQDSMPDKEKELEKKELELLRRKGELTQKEFELKHLEEELAQWQQELEEQEEQLHVKMNEETRDHIKLLNHLLTCYEDTIQSQAKRKPDAPMSPKQIRTINEVLSELKYFFTTAETDNLLHLAEEPDPATQNPGTTNGEMALLLSAYKITTNAFLYGELRPKHKKT